MRIQPIRNSLRLMRALSVTFSMAKDSEFIQTQRFCHNGDTICHPSSSYATTKRYETSACGCNNNTIVQKVLFSRFLPSTYAGQVSLAEVRLGDPFKSSEMATQLNSLSLMFTILFLPKYRVTVKYYEYIVKWCSGISCNWCVSLDIA